MDILEIIVMPRFGVTMNAGKVVSWKKEEGDEVNIGDIILVVESEKATVEVESPYSGVLRKILVAAGEEVPIGSPLAVIVAKNEEFDLDDLDKYYQKEDMPATEKKEQKEEDGVSTSSIIQDKREIQYNPKSKVSPKARRLAKKMGVPLETIAGTGPGGAITEKDVYTAATDNKKGADEEITMKPLSTMQKAMSSNVSSSWQNIPQYTQIVTVHADRLLKIRQQLESISLNDIIVKAVARAVSCCPYVNSRLEKDNILFFKKVNLSIAMATDKGLVVPVIKNADQKTVYNISQDLATLYEKASAGELSKEELSGGTLTISNLGYHGIETGTPIINYPQSTIVFVGAIQKIPVVENEQVVVMPCFKLSIAYDHRFIDGATAAKFTTCLKRELEEISLENIS